MEFAAMTVFFAALALILILFTVKKIEVRRQQRFGVRQLGEVPCRQSDATRAPGAQTRGPADFRHRAPGAGGGTAGQRQRLGVIAQREISARDVPPGAYGVQCAP